MSLTQKEKDAFEQVKSTVANLRAEYDTVCAEIVVTEKQLAELPLKPVPLADLKAAILDFVDARGQAYLNEKIAPAIRNFATCGMNGVAAKGVFCQPMTFEDLERSHNGTGAASYGQLLTMLDKHQFNDHVLYALFADLVKEGLSSAMDTMTEADFGYANLTPGQIGTDRATRRQAIQAAQDQLEALHARKAEISSSLRQLGVSVKG